MTEPADIDHLNARVDEAIAGIGDLRRSVEGMTHATTVLAQVQQEQIEIKNKAAKAEKAALAATETATAGTRKTRQSFRRVAAAFVAVVVLFAAGIAASNNAAANRANDAAQMAAQEAKQLINAANSERIPACESRNASTRAQIRRERALADLPEMGQAEARVHNQSADQVELLIFDCTVYKPIP